MVTTSWGLPGTRGWLGDDEIDGGIRAGEGSPIGKSADREEAQQPGADVVAFSTVECLFGQAELAARSPANLDGDQPARRPRVESHDVELVAADADLPREEGPSEAFEMGGHECFGRVATGLLEGRRVRRGSRARHGMSAWSGMAGAWQQGLDGECTPARRRMHAGSSFDYRRAAGGESAPAAGLSLA
ncbi:MAG TPA: hypothetical protein VF802_09540 [Candidatus Limnocylindrales bacterium]